MATLKKITLLLAAGLSIFGIQYFCHKQTDGFSVSKIRSAAINQNISPKHCSYSQEEINLVTDILKQSLYYIGKGGQCYAFSTEDDKYVVKLLKYNNNYPRMLFRLVPFPFGLESYRQEKLARKLKKLKGEYASYDIAMQELKEETGILYFHLQSETLPNLKLHIKDKLQIQHHLSADSYQFYIQKKGTPFYPGLEQMINEGKLETAKLAIDNMVSFLFKRCQKKITDGDDGIWRNFAFQGSLPFQIDIGQFSYDPSLCTTDDYKNDILFFTKDFRNWLSKTNPELSEYCMNAISSVSSEQKELSSCP